MSEVRLQRRLAAILAADVVGYSRMMGEDEGGVRARFNAAMETVIAPAITEHRGRLFKTMGDGLLAEFGSVVDAVDCAVRIQDGMETFNRYGAPALLLRIGVNLGDVIIEGEDLHGDGVNVAARLEGLAERALDLAYALLGPILVRPLTRAFVLVAAVLAFGLATGTFDRETLRAAFDAPTWLDGLPRGARVLVVLVSADALGYVAHRLFHRGGFLWRAHAVHHSSEHLDWLSSFRGHPLNEVFGGIARVVPLVLVGARPGELAFLLPLLGVHGLLLHARVPWRFGPLRFVIASPAFHRWHHSVDRDCNYAGLFPIWDLLFGTYHLPDELPARTGTRDRVPRAFLAQLAHPFRRR